jgi:hypothetical protein
LYQAQVVLSGGKSVHLWLRKATEPAFILVNYHPIISLFALLF